MRTVRDDLISVSEFARRYGKSRNTVYSILKYLNTEIICNITYINTSNKTVVSDALNRVATGPGDYARGKDRPFRMPPNNSPDPWERKMEADWRESMGIKE